MLKMYHRISLGISVLFTIALTASLFILAGSTEGAHDGSGPGSSAIIFIFISYISSFALVNSFAASITVLVTSKRKVTEGQRGVGINLILAVIMFSPYLLAPAKEFFGNMDYRASEYFKMSKAIESGSLEEFNSHFEKIPLSESSDTNFNNRVINLAADALRLDILQDIKSKGIAIASPSSPQTWIDHIELAVRSKNVVRQKEKLKIVSWLLDEGAGNHYTLTPYELSFYINSFPHGPFAQINDPEMIKLFELLVSHGADINSCGEDICALWMSAHFGKFDHVKFLIVHGAKLDTISKNSENSALSEAINHSYVQVAEVLLNAGARISHQPYNDDVIHACWQYNNSSHSDASVAMLNFLKNAKIHMTEKNLMFYTDQNALDKPVYECARQFLVN